MTGAVVLGFCGWVVTLFIESPEEAAANAAPPAPSLITAPVALRKVGEEIVTRGLVTATQTVEAVSELAGQNAKRSIVTGHIPSAGDQVEHGDVVVEVSGRPVFALQADVPAYRDLNPGDTGADVQRLNAALAAAGFPTAKDSPSYDRATEDAVRSLYSQAGYTSNGNLPAGEVIFISALPATVANVSASLGMDSADASVLVASGQLTVSAEVPPQRASLVKPGAKVVLSSELLGESVDATVQAAAPPEAKSEREGSDNAQEPQNASPDADADSGAEADSGSSAFVIVPDDPLPSAWAGQDVRVRIVSATTGERVLAVPVTAIVSNGAGETEVVVVTADAGSALNAKRRRVPVDVGVVGGGWAQVTPVKGAKLEESDLVQLSAAPRDGQ